MAGERLPSQRGLIEISRLGQCAIHRHDFAVPHQQPVTRPNFIQADWVPLPAVEAIGLLGRVTQQRGHFTLRPRLSIILQRSPAREHQRNDRRHQHFP